MAGLRSRHASGMHMNTLTHLYERGIYPVTLHNYTKVGEIGGRVESVEDWVNLGITVGKTPVYTGDPDEKKVIRGMLDACAEAGLMCFVNDGRANARIIMEEGEDAYRAGFAEALKDWGDHPATFGFELGDEPAQQRIGPVFRAHGIQRELAPQFTPFLSLGAYSPGAIEWMGLRSYKRYLEELIEVGGANVLFHNNYGMVRDQNGQAGDEGSLLALKMFSDVSLENNHIPTWVTLCCVTHYTMADITENDLRRQLNVAAALGQKGVAWYLLYMSIFQDYRLAPRDEHDEKTEVYYWLRRVMKTFHRMHGPVLAKLKFQQAYHEDNTRVGGYPNTIDSELVKRVSVWGNDFPAIVAEFKDDAGQDYVAIVNNSPTKAGHGLITWHGAPKIFVQHLDGEEREHRPYFDDEWPENPAIQSGPWLAPGQMELYRVEADVRERL
jgi:hypothetical protein